MFGMRLKFLREKRLLTQEMLAKELHVSVKTIQMYESSKRKPDYKMLIKIKRFFDVTITHLIGSTEE